MDKEAEKDLDYLYQRREQLDHDKFELSNILDRYLFVAATGAIPLTLGFKKILGDQIEHSYMLKTSISFFLLCIFGTLLSIRFSIKAYEKQVDITDQEIRLQTGEADEICRKNSWNKVVRWASTFSGMLFGSGALVAVIFYYLNIK